MSTQDSLTLSTSDFVFAKPGDVYAIYLPDRRNNEPRSTGQSGTFDVTWFNPRTGVYSEGSDRAGLWRFNGRLGTAPNAATEDWAILITKKNRTHSAPDGATRYWWGAPEQPSPGVESLAKSPSSWIRIRTRS